MATIQRMSTSAVAPADRLSYWNDASARAFGATVVDADERDGFQAELTRLSAGRFEIVSVKSTPAVTRGAARAVKVRGDADIFRLQLVHSGQCLMRHGGRDCVITTGDLIVADVSKSYELAFEAPLHGLTASVPWDRFAPFAESLDASAGRPLETRRGPGAVLSTFLRSSWDHLVENDGEDWPDSADQVVWDLLEALLRGETPGEVAAGRADRLRRRARALVDAHLSDAAFGCSEIASALGVSMRSLQMAFAEMGTTPSRFLRDRRLEAAAARLRRRDEPCSITDLALECGFNDLSYFSRSFRCRFGVSPLAYRRGLGAPRAALL